MKLRKLIVATIALTACFGGSNLSPTGDITAVLPGTGLSGGATVGSATLTLAMTAQSCSAGNHISGATATGVFTCTADSGGITNTASANYYAKSNGTNLVNGVTKDDNTNWTINTVAGGSTAKFTVVEASGNTSIAGTLDAVGNVTENSVRVISLCGDGMTKTGGTCDAVARIGGGLTVGVSDISLITTCGNNEILKWSTGTSTWTCQADAGGTSYTAGTSLSLVGTVFDIASRDFGDITTSSTGSVMTIDNDVVTYAKMQNVSATSRILCRITAAAGDMEECTGTQATTLLDTFATAATTKGLVPGSNSAGASAYLNGNGGWTVPPDLGAPSLITGTLASNQNNWTVGGSLTSTTTAVSLTSVTASTDIGGVSSSGRVNGSTLTFTNDGGNTFTVSNENGSSSTANQIKTIAGVSRTIGNYGSFTIVFNGTKWVELSEGTRYTPELYDLGAMHVDGTADLIGNVLTYGNTTIGDTSGDTLSVPATATFNANVTIATGQVVDAKGRVQTELLSGISTPSTPTSCGGSPAIDPDSTNLAGSFTTGSATTACTITFTATWPVRPWCMVTKSDGVVLAPTNITDGTTTLVLAGLSASTTYRYWCTGGH